MTLKIIQATYSTKKNGIDVTEHLRKKVTGGSLAVVVNNGIAGDPQYGKVKKLKVRYVLDGVEHEKTVSEGRRLLIESQCSIVEPISEARPAEKAIFKPVTYSIKPLTVVIPCREEDGQQLTLESLSKQTFQHFSIVVAYDDGRGASFARNKGFSQCNSPYVLFSDNDIIWKPNAIKIMMDALQNNPDKSYAYGWYRRGKEVCSRKQFDEEILKKYNFINTMAVIRSKDFPGFDEKIKRLQDWDLWLNMLFKGKTGFYVNRQVFSTPKIKGKGITYGNSISYDEAMRIVKEKYNL